LHIVHTADWHIGKALSGHDLVPDQEHAWSQLLGRLAGEDADAVVVAGDLFDRANPSGEEMRILGRWLQALRATRPELPIVLISGNHDHGTRLAWSGDLLDPTGVHLRGAPERVADPVLVRGRDGDEAQIWCVPFLHPGAMGEPEPSQVGAMEEALRRIRPLQDPGRTQILVGHAFVQGGQASESERTFLGTASLLSPAIFAGFDYVALGHLHRPQQVGEHAWYPGSLARYSFSEAGHGKGWLDVLACRGRAPVVRERPLRSFRAMHRLRGSLDQLLTDPAFDDKVEDYVDLWVDPPSNVGNPLQRLRARFRYVLGFRNELAWEQRSPVSGGPRERIGHDVVADFTEFEARFPDGAVPRSEIVRAFQSLHATTPHGEVEG
jgi:exonuclease SbcD